MAGEKPQKSTVSTWLEAELITRIDELQAYFSQNWRKASRSDVVRAAILEALPKFEKLKAQGDRRPLEKLLELHGGPIKKKTRPPEQGRSRKKP